MDESLFLSIGSAFALLLIGIVVFAVQFSGLFFKKIKMPFVLWKPLVGILLGTCLLCVLPLLFPGFAQGLLSPEMYGGPLPVGQELHLLFTLCSVVLFIMADRENNPKMFFKYSYARTFMGRRQEEGRLRHQDGLHEEKRGSRQFFGRIKRNLIGDFSFFNDKNQKTKTNKNEKKDLVWPFHPDKEYTLERILPDTCVLTDMEAQDYESAVNEMVLYLHRRGYVENMEMCINDIRLRERIESTVNAEKGLAFPHARTTQATRLISVVGLCNGKCEDSKLQSKTMIIVLTLGPKDITYPYMQYIAHAASALMAHPDLDGLRCIDDSRILRDVIVKR